ncbi:MAG: hypothetical protein WBM53_15565 [Maribacter sp.]
MKTIFKLLLVPIMLIAFSCSTESVTDLSQENLNAAAVKSGKKVKRPISARLTNFPDFDIEAITCYPELEPDFPNVTLNTNIISGNMTHLGKLRQGSFGRPQAESCYLQEDGSLQVIYKVNYIAANGDEIRTTEYVTIICDDADCFTGTFDGTEVLPDGVEFAIVIDGGSGRFDGATGHMNFVGAAFGPDGSSWELEGEITY